MVTLGFSYSAIVRTGITNGMGHKFSYPTTFINRNSKFVPPPPQRAWDLYPKNTCDWDALIKGIAQRHTSRIRKVSSHFYVLISYKKLQREKRNRRIARQPKTYEGPEHIVTSINIKANNDKVKVSNNHINNDTIEFPKFDVRQKRKKLNYGNVLPLYKCRIREPIREIPKSNGLLRLLRVTQERKEVSPLHVLVTALSYKYFNKLQIPKTSLQPQGFKDIFSLNTKVNDCVENVSESAKSIKLLTNKLQEFITPVTEKLTETKDHCMVKVGNFLITKLLSKASDSSEIYNFFSHIIYAIIGRTKSIVCFSIFNIYKSLFGLSFKGISSLTSKLSTCWDKIASSIKRPQKIQPQDGYETISKDTEDSINEVGGALFSAIALACNLKLTPPTTFGNVNKLVQNVGYIKRGETFACAFITAMVKLCKKTVSRISEYFQPKHPDIAIIAGIEDTRLQVWVKEAIAMTDESIQDTVLTSPQFSNKIFELSIIGKGIMNLMLNDTSIMPRAYNIVKDLYTKIVKIETKLIKRKVFSGVRYEPFCLWVSGNAGTMKTTFVQQVAEQLAQEMQYSGPQSYYPMTPGQKYFDGYSNQPCIYLDDFLAISPSIDPELYSQYLQMKSNVQFNPPFSAVEDKDTFINFPLLAITSNFHGFVSQPAIHDPDAYNRRRNLVLKFEFADPTINASNVTSKYTLEQITRMEHIVVKYAPDPLTFNSWAIVPLQSSMSTAEALRMFVLDKFRDYDVGQADLYAKRSKIVSERLEQVPLGKSLSVYLKQVTETLVELGNMENSSDISSSITSWMSRKKEAASFAEMQGDCNPFISVNKNLKEGALYEPVSRTNSNFSTPALLTTTATTSKSDFKCLHHMFDGKNSDYDEEFDAWISMDDCKESPQSVSNNPCQYVVNDEHGGLTLRDYPFCQLLAEENGLLRFYKRLTKDRMEYSPGLYNHLQRYISKETVEDYTGLYPKTFLELLSQIIVPLNRKDARVSKSASPAMRAISCIQREQANVSKGLDLIGNVVISKQTSIWKKCLIVGASVTMGLISGIILLLKSVRFIAVSILSILIVVGTFRAFFPSSDKEMEEDVESQLHASGDHKTLKSTRQTRHKALALMKPSPQNSNISDLNLPALGGVKKKILGNMFFMIGIKHLEDGTSITYPSVCIGLYNKTAIVIKHYIDHFLAVGCTEVSIVKHNYNGLKTYLLSELDFNWIIEAGYGVVTFPNSFPVMFRDIRKNIVSDTFDGGFPSNGTLVELTADGFIEYEVPIKKITTPKVVPGTLTQASWCIKQGFEYPFGGKGKCGSILLCESMASPLVGIHTAGIGNVKGYAESIYRETFVTDELVLEYVEPQLNEDPMYMLEGEADILGGLDKDLSLHQPGDTKIVPSDIAGVFPILTEPAPLSKTDIRINGMFDPLHEGVKKRCEPTREFNKEDLEVSVEDLSEMLIHNAKPQRAEVGVLTYKQAIEGFHNIKGYDSIEMSTSEGYPWRLMRPSNANNKSWLFDLDMRPEGLYVKGIHPSLKEVLDMKNKQREDGMIPATYYSACLKDARISKDKILQPGKTRVFEISPVDLTIAHRQYFLDFQVAYQNCRLECENTIGIAADGQEWTELSSRLLAFSPYILTADYSGYGPKMNSAVMFGTFKVMQSWYRFHNHSDLDDKIRSVMAHENTHALHVVRDCVFRPVCGMPSGNAATVVINSLANSLYIRMAYLTLARENAKQYADLFYFHSFILLYHNGDDLIISVKETIISWFNNKTLIDFFNRYGLKMTDALKSGSIREYCSLTEASYLKRGFMLHPKRENNYLAPLEESSITDTANWVKRSINMELASLVNSEMCLRLAYTRGPIYYSSIMKRLKRAWRLKNVRFEAPQWEIIDINVWDLKVNTAFKFIQLDFPLEPQMDTEGSSTSIMPKSDKHNSSVIQTMGPTEVGSLLPVIQGFKNMAVASENQVYETMTDRWLFYGIIAWQTKHTINERLLVVSLPYDIINKNREAPNTQLFLTHRWFRFDIMRIKVSLVSNPFQVGQLVVSWIYGPLATSAHRNVYSALQRNHVLLNAGNSNTVELEIPFYYINSTMTMQQNLCALGYLEIYVLNPLIVTPSVAPQCSFSVFVTFEGTEFSGLVSRKLLTKALDVIEPQMDTIGKLINVAPEVLSTIGREFNRDNPPIPLQPMSFVPQAVPSFSYTDNIGEPINVLRAASIGQTPSVISIDEMNPIYISKKWGFMKTIKWKVDDLSDTTLWNTFAAPLLPQRNYPKVSTSSEKSIPFIPTPLAGIASMYGMWRGDIEYRLDIIASHFHRGRLMMASVPYHLKSDFISIQDLKYSPNLVIDVNDSASVSYLVPWFWKNAWANTRKHEDSFQAPSQFFIKVVNPLICIDSVSPIIYINVYVRAGQNYELAIPRHPLLQPTLGEKVVPPPDENLIPYNTEIKVYASWERNLVFKDNKRYGSTLYIQNVTDGWLGFTNLQPGRVYELSTKTKKRKYFKVVMNYANEGKQWSSEVGYGVYDKALSTANAHGLAIFPRTNYWLAYAKQFADATRSDSWPSDEVMKDLRQATMPSWTVDGPWSQISDDGVHWQMAENSDDRLIWTEIWPATFKETDEYEIIEPQMNTTPIITLDQPATSTNRGILTFGEKTPDLKALCRRWNYITSTIVRSCGADHIKQCPFSFMLKVHPKFLFGENTNSQSYENRAREGIIPTITSMYAYWRGGLRYRFVVDHPNAVVYVQHRFDTQKNNEAPFVILGPNKVRNYLDLMLPQYATYVQATSVNKIFSVEIPYYQQCEQLYVPTMKNDVINGMLCVWVHTPAAESVAISIYMSFADDTRSSVFQGMQEMIDISTISPVSQYP